MSAPDPAALAAAMSDLANALQVATPIAARIREMEREPCRPHEPLQT